MQLTETQQHRVLTLLKAGLDIAKKSDELPSKQEFKLTTAIWDGVECDGACWSREVELILEEVSL